MAKAFLYRWNLWPPFLGLGIHIENIADDMMSLDVRLKYRFWNRNIVGTHFGGAIYAMTDPFYMALLIYHLGSDYRVWDKAASIMFLKPGRSDLKARFSLTSRDLEGIKERLEQTEKIDYVRKVEILDAKGQLIAEVEKVIYIRNLKFTPLSDLTRNG